MTDSLPQLRAPLQQNRPPYEFSCATVDTIQRGAGQPDPDQANRCFTQPAGN